MKQLLFILCFLSIGGCSVNNTPSEKKDLYYSVNGDVVVSLTSLVSKLDNSVIFVRGQVIIADRVIDLSSQDYSSCLVVESQEKIINSMNCTGSHQAEFKFDSNGRIESYLINMAGMTSLAPTSSYEVHFYSNGVKSKIITSNSSSSKTESFNLNGLKVKEMVVDKDQYLLNVEKVWDEKGNLIFHTVGGRPVEYEKKNDDGLIFEKLTHRDEDGLTTTTKYHDNGSLASKEYHFLEGFRYRGYDAEFKYLDGKFPSLSRNGGNDRRGNVIFDLIVKARDLGVPVIFEWDSGNNFIVNDLYKFFMAQEFIANKENKVIRKKEDESYNREIKARQEIYSIGLHSLPDDIDKLYFSAGGSCKTSTTKTIGQPDVDTMTCKLNSTTYHFYHFINKKMIKMNR